MLIRRQPKHPRKRPTQQKNICEAECWAALSVIGILVLFCLSCIIHDYVVRKRKRKLDALRKAAELESVKINNIFSSEKSNDRTANDVQEMSRDQQMRNIRTVMKQMKENQNFEGEKSDTLVDESSEDTESEGDPKTSEQMLPEFDKGKQKEIMD
ncbi:1346_t:CDS:2 [Racocetra fulgida]|uniref:1346_t:CDS:1 n=1 Tax=Racocetra fulgida TaxID=60492 RepID=A0A9N8ZZE7_9GLOM|nr:1346_t:CDS:2 [Racocetra fulgida]